MPNEVCVEIFNNPEKANTREHLMNCKPFEVKPDVWHKVIVHQILEGEKLNVFGTVKSKFAKVDVSRVGFPKPWWYEEAPILMFGQDKKSSDPGVFEHKIRYRNFKVELMDGSPSSGDSSTSSSSAIRSGAERVGNR